MTAYLRSVSPKHVYEIEVLGLSPVFEMHVYRHPCGLTGLAPKECISFEIPRGVSVERLVKGRERRSYA